MYKVSHDRSRVLHTNILVVRIFFVRYDSIILGVSSLHWNISVCLPATYPLLSKYFPLLIVQDFKAKLSDFGLAKDGPEGDASHVSTRVMGTEGYCAPEYVMTGKSLQHLEPLFVEILALNVENNTLWKSLHCIMKSNAISTLFNGRK